MVTQAQCEPFAIGAQRGFWTTRLDACEPLAGCSSNECGRPSLKLEQAGDGAFFATGGWVASLCYNMLLTDARRRDTRCGTVPGALNGHWSESFIARGKPVGSHVRYIPPSASIGDAALLIKAEVRDTLQKLIDYGIAVDVTVEAKYSGDNFFSLDIQVLGNAVDPTRVALTAQRNANSWAWVN